MPDSRIIHLPFSFRVKGIQKGHRKTETVHFLDTLPVRVPDLTGEDVPVAAEFRTADGIGLRRVHQGRLMRFLGSPTGFGQAKPTEMSLEGLEAAIAMAMAPPLHRYPKWKAYPLPLHHQDERMVRLPRRDEVTFREILSDHEEEDRAAAARASANLVFVDGVLHTPASEPRWKVEPWWDGAVRQGYDVRLYASADKDTANETFAIDRKADAVALARHLAGDRKVRMGGDPVDHGLVRWKTNHAAEGARRMVTDLSGTLEQSKGSFRLSRDFMMAFCDLRDLRDAGTLDGHTVQAPCNALLAALEDVHPRCAELAPRLRARIGQTLWRVRHIDAGPPVQYATTSDDGDILAAAFT